MMMHCDHDWVLMMTLPSFVRDEARLLIGVAIWSTGGQYPLYAISVGPARFSISFIFLFLGFIRHAS